MIAAAFGVIPCGVIVSLISKGTGGRQVHILTGACRLDLAHHHHGHH
jgi:hypothetical protein